MVVSQVAGDDGGGCNGDKTFKEPSYKEFRQYSVFVPELADFAVNERSLAKLLGSVELLWGNTGLGTGDLTILFNACASRPVTASLAGGAPLTPSLTGSYSASDWTSSTTSRLIGVGGVGGGAHGGPCRWLTYDGVTRISRLLAQRAQKVYTTLAQPPHPQNQARTPATPAVGGTRTAPASSPQTGPTSGAAASASATPPHPAPHPPHPHHPPGSALMHILNGPPSLSPSAGGTRSTSPTSRIGSPDPTGGSWRRPHAQHSDSEDEYGEWSTSQSIRPRMVPRRVFPWEAPGLRPQPQLAPADPAAAAPSAPSANSLMLSGQQGGGQGVPEGGVEGGRWASSALGQQAGEEGDRGVGMASVMSAQDPPVLLREIIALPASVESAALRQRLSGVAVLVGAGEGKLAGNALREVVKDWEAAVGERLLKEAMRRAKRKGADAEAEADIEAASRPELPAEGSAWALMTGSAAARTEGRHPEAIRLALAAAPFVASLPPSHSYHHTLPLCLGCALYGAKQFPQALQQFKKAVEVAERGAAVDYAALRCVGAGANNAGAAAQLLGSRAEAVRLYRQAVSVLTRANHPQPSLHPSRPASAMPAAKTPAKPGTRPKSPTLPRPVSASAAGGAAAAASPTTHPTPTPATAAPPTLASATTAAAPAPASATTSAPALPASNAVSPPPALKPATKKLPATKRPPGIDAPALDVASANLARALKHSFAIGPLPLSQHTLPAGLRSSAAAVGASRTLGLRQSQPSQPSQRPATAPPARTAQPFVGAASSSGAVSGMLASTVVGVLDKARTPVPTAVTAAGGSSGGVTAGGNSQGTLTQFLRGALTAVPPPPPTALPPWAVRATEASIEASGKGKAKKGASAKKVGKGKKDKKGEKKKKVDKGFQISYPGVYYDPPMFSVANVKLEKAKKKGTTKKKA